jgi:hypothetical protein
MQAIAKKFPKNLGEKYEMAHNLNNHGPIAFTYGRLDHLDQIPTSGV